MLCGLIDVSRMEGRFRMHRFLRRARRPAAPAGAGRADRGASSVEYALLVAAIAAVLIAVLLGLASIVKDAFSSTGDCIDSGGASTSCPTPSN
jgi:pilus assembly protein Flp/PilA